MYTVQCTLFYLDKNGLVRIHDIIRNELMITKCAYSVFTLLMRLLAHHFNFKAWKRTYNLASLLEVHFTETSVTNGEIVLSRDFCNNRRNCSLSRLLWQAEKLFSLETSVTSGEIVLSRLLWQAEKLFSLETSVTNGEIVLSRDFCDKRRNCSISRLLWQAEKLFSLETSVTSGETVISRDFCDKRRNCSLSF